MAGASYCMGGGGGCFFRPGLAPPPTSLELVLRDLGLALPPGLRELVAKGGAGLGKVALEGL